MDSSNTEAQAEVAYVQAKLDAETVSITSLSDGESKR